MAEFVAVARHGDIAVVTIDNPPVNAMSFHVRAPLTEALRALAEDNDVAGIVVACAGRTFVAGADITEFGKPMQRPDLRDIVALLEAIAKPTVAAIHGTALGGGLELALGCHFRVADRAAKLGLPEVKLGLLPGAGGTIRLPRLIGPVKALEMIATGTPIGAEAGLANGLVDAIADGDLVAVAIAFARGKAAATDHPVPVRERNEKLSIDLAAFDQAAAELTRKQRGLDAPKACAESVRNAITQSFDEALEAERTLFVRLVSGDQSRAQRHLFFAEREAAKVADIGKDIKPRDIRRAGVIGAGTMGGGIAMAFANAGIAVTMLEMSADALARGLAMIEKNYAASVARGSLGEDVKAKRIGLISGTTDYADLADADLIVEAAFEEIGVKRDIFGKLDRIAKPGAILASNTSYLDVDEIAAATGRPSDVLGLHFFSPANVMKLVEIVRARETSRETLASALGMAKRIGKVPVVVGVCRGFVGNRMLRARGAENESLLLEGASPEQIDTVFYDFGWPMGPFQMGDLAGLDISWRNRKALGETAAIADVLCESGRFGQKTGKGWYLYPEGSRTPVSDAAVTALIEKEAEARGIKRRDISTDEIIERTLYPLVNEGARILEEAIAARASDIDIVWTNGYGFPIGKGGPMFWAGLEGFGKIVERLEYWHARTGKAVFQPSQWLRQAAEGGSDVGNG